MLTEFEERILAAASVARSEGFIQTYLALLEVVRELREGTSMSARPGHFLSEDTAR